VVVQIAGVLLEATGIPSIVWSLLKNDALKRVVFADLSLILPISISINTSAGSNKSWHFPKEQSTKRSCHFLLVILDT
jgi:hypothetical protein